MTEYALYYFKYDEAILTMKTLIRYTLSPGSQTSEGRRCDVCMFFPIGVNILYVPFVSICSETDCTAILKTVTTNFWKTERKVFDSIFCQIYILTNLNAGTFDFLWITSFQSWSGQLGPVDLKLWSVLPPIGRVRISSHWAKAPHRGMNAIFFFLQGLKL